MSSRVPRSRPSAAIALASALALALAACGGGEEESSEPTAIDPDADLSKQTVVVSNWDAYMPEDIGKIVKEETGATVKVTNHATNEELVAKVTGSGGQGLDVIFGPPTYCHQPAAEGLPEPAYAQNP